MRIACNQTTPPVGRPQFRRRGAMMLETQIALIVLGIGLAGLCPLVVMQMKQLANLEAMPWAMSPYPPPLTNPQWRLQAQDSTYTYVYGRLNVTPDNGGQYQPPQPISYYLVPWNYPWTRKLTTRAQVLTTSVNANDTSPVQAQHVTLLQPPPGQPQGLGNDPSGNPTATVWVQIQ